jgi:hypothetical protein
MNQSRNNDEINLKQEVKVIGFGINLQGRIEMVSIKITNRRAIVKYHMRLYSFRSLSTKYDMVLN